jgi:hypothetical protein
MWTLAVVIILMGAGAYYYSTSINGTTAATVEVSNTTPTNLPAGDMAPTPSTPIASSTVGASTTLGQ